MAKSKNSLRGLVNQLSRVKSDGQGVNRVLSPTDVINSVQSGGTESSPRVGSSGDTKITSLNARVMPESIKFGKPSQSTPKSSSTPGSEWANLLKQTASGGIANAFGGTFGSIGGLGSLISGFASLFGGGSNKKTLPPLVEFQMPASQQETLYVSSKGTNAYQGPAVTLQTQTGEVTGTSEWIQSQSSQIAQAVKNALLNSSSLNDVITEI